MSQTQRLRLALVGCGNIARSHWSGIQRHAPLVEVTAAVDTDSERAAAMAAQTGGKAFTSLETALAQGDFDAVDIMLPHNEHEAAAIMAFAAGKHVMLEKPMAPTLDACQRIMAAASKAATVFMVAEQAEYWPESRTIRGMVEAGELGELITAHALFGGSYTHPLPAGEPKPWRYDLAATGGGIVIDGGAHWIRPLRMWLGEVDEAVAVTGRPDKEMEGESYARALLRFKSGVVASFDAMRVGFALNQQANFRLIGTKGEIAIEKGRGARALFFDRDTPEGRIIDDQVNEGHASAFGYELDDFSRAVLHGSQLAAPPEYSLGELRTALAIYRSAQSGQWEKVWDA
jgi:UDP-N-acetyl-2-amino-2-deoxyglucuronate dehydrogenase